MYGAKQVGIDLPLDLSVINFFRRAEQRVSLIADNDVDPLEVGKRLLDDTSNVIGVHDIEDLNPESVAVRFLQVVQSACLANGGGDPVTSLQQNLGELAAEAAAGASDKPCS
ncbi:hypothetical protein SAMN05518854_11478 [Variovorax sp. YR266]|nr:hypothetical protein SAMN05518854_11478 [Variovorax sp. YR266]